MEKDKLVKIGLIMLVLLLSGFTIGFLVGGKTMQDQWEAYFEKKNAEIERYCYCSYPETSGQVSNTIRYSPI